MTVNKDFEDLLRFLNQEKAEYLIVGAYAVIFYTEPRYTKDIDIWIRPEADNACKVYQALKKFGAPVKNISPADLANPELMYQIGIEPNRIDILAQIDGVKFDKAWKYKRINVYGHEKIYIMDLGDLIKAKQVAGRPQDKIDLERLKLAQSKIKSKVKK